MLVLSKLLLVPVAASQMPVSISDPSGLRYATVTTYRVNGRKSRVLPSIREDIEALFERWTRNTASTSCTIEKAIESRKFWILGYCSQER